MTNYLNARELKDQASLVDLLTKLGFHPVKKAGTEHIYRSMLRDSDTKPSFCVNDELGVWFDHGTGKGGNIIDFGLAFWKQLTFNQVVEKIQDVCAIELNARSTRPRKAVKTPHYIKAVKTPHYIIEEVKGIGTHPVITEYLKNRGVFEIALASMNEVYYYVQDQKGERKYFFAAGWQNENGSWEVRHKYFKGCLGHKGISFIQGDKKNLAVFEGYINYLSWKSENTAANQSVLVLNTLALLGAGIAKAKEFSSIDLFLDRDQPGYMATKEFVKALPYASDRSGAYLGFNDYNDKLVAASPVRSAIDLPEVKQKSAVSL